MPLLGSLAAGSVKGFGATLPTGYFLGQSLRFRSSASAYLERTPTTIGNRKTWTWSGWVKRGTLSSNQIIFSANPAGTSDGSKLICYFTTSDQISIDGALNQFRLTNAVFRDPSAWYHIIVSADTTNATADNRFKIYVNGIQQTMAVSYAYPQDNNAAVNGVFPHYLGYFDGASLFYDGYMGDVYLIDGQALTPSDFGKTDPSTGSWIPKKYSGTYGTNGFKLDFKHQSSASGFNTVTYTGNGTSQSITGVGFSPDLVWFKARSGVYSHTLIDSVRGTNKILFSNTTDADTTETNNLTSFNNSGFSVSNSNNVNGGYNYVAWCWDAGSSTVSNTDGTITSSVRANPATGFSIVTYTGTGGSGTVGHGLSSAPNMIIVKPRNTVNNWLVYHSSLGAGNFIELNLTNAATANTTPWNNTSPTSSVFSVNTPSGLWTNYSGEPYVAYCFSEVAGYSKFGSYTGNGTSQSINLGFRPAFVMWKRTDGGTNSWIIKDNTRYADNQGNLFPNSSDVNTDTSVTFTDTGFDVDSALGYNGSGRVFIYMAFADTRDTAFWRDKSGTDNHWSLNAINYAASAETTYDLMNDVPTLTSADKSNFATLNSLSKASTQTVSQANLLSTINSARPVYSRIDATMGVTGGKWYFEYVKGTGSSGLGGAGFKAEDTNLSLTLAMPDNTGSLTNVGFCRFGTTNAITVTGLSTATTVTGTYTLGDVLGVALDADAGKLYFYLNGVELSGQIISSGTSLLPTMDSSKTYIPFVYNGNGGSGTELVYNYMNFGQRPFKYTPPTGYKKLNTYNL